MSAIKEKWVKIKEKLIPSGHKKAYSFIIAGVLVLGLFCVWFFMTPTGQLAQYSFFKSFNDIPEEHVIEVYSDGTKIKEYVGFYRIEKYQTYYVIISEKTNERVDIYGADMVIVNEMKEWEKSEILQDKGSGD